MERKENRASSLPGGTDPLVWLKSELLREGEEGEFSHDVAKELDALAARLAQVREPRTAPRDEAALEAFVELLPSESLTEEFVESVNRRRKNRGRDDSPATTLKQLRATAGVTLPSAAEALGIPSSELESLESNSAPWHHLPAERLGRYAALIQQPVSSVLDRLKHAAKRHLISQAEDRLRLALGRYDKAQGASRARLDALRTALAMLRDENQAAMSFFRRAERASRVK